MMQSRDELRTQAQNMVRDVIAGRGDPQAGALALPPMPPEFAVDLLRAEMAGARKEIAELTAQLTTSVSGAREQAIQGQLGLAQERLQSLQERMDLIVAQATTSSRTAGALLPPGAIPPEAVNISIWFFATCAVTIVSIAVIRPWARWLDRRGHPAPSSPEIAARLDRMEQAIDSVAIEVERIAEGQRFANTVMSELRALPPAAGPGAALPISQREPVVLKRELRP